MNISRLSIFMLLFLFLLASISSSQAASIKERMAARIPAINALKDKGVVGENNQGYLEYRAAEKPQQQIVNEENADRKTVYQAIGKNQGAPTELVGQRRAAQIADIGKQGHWFQKPDGSWYKK